MYTVDQVAEILHLHPATVRRFIREGRLKARKAGKQWRVTEQDIKDFLGDEGEVPGSDGLLSSPGDKEGEGIRTDIQVSAVVDLHNVDKDEVIRMANSLFAALNCKDPSYGPARCDHLYMKDEGKARFIIWGGIKVVRDLLACIEKIAE